MESKQQQTAAGSDKSNIINTTLPSTSQAVGGGAPLPQQLILRVQGLPATATNDKLAAFLTEKKVPYQVINVEIDQSVKQCRTGFGSISFVNRADCKFLIVIAKYLIQS